MDFNVKDFGATGDGASDDTAAIQAAIDAAAKAGGGTVYLPAGEYRVSGGDEAADGALMIRSNVQIAGAGMGETVIKLVDGWDRKLTGIIRSKNGEETHDYGIRDLTLDGNRAHTSGEVDGFYTGYIPGETGADYNVTAERVEIREVSRYGFDPHERTVNLTIRDSVSHDNGKDGFVADFQIDGTFENNLAYGNGRHGFNIVTSSHDMLLRNNVAYGNGANGLVVQRGSEDRALVYGVQIEGGAYHDNGQEGVLIKMSRDVVLQGAEVYGNGAAGVQVQGAENVQILDNRIHDNAQDGATAEVVLESYDDRDGVSGNYYRTLNAWVQGNTIAGSANSTYGVLERADGTDYSTVGDNTISATQRGTVLLGGAHSTLSEQPVDGSPTTIGGSDGNDLLSGGDADERLLGGAGSDRLDGGAGDDLLVGGAGRDSLVGGAGADLFRFEALSDSRRRYDAADNQGDRLLDFDPASDRIDVSALGFTGLGDGYHGTLAVLLNDTGDRTYVKSYETGADGYRFEFSLDGDYQGRLGAGQFVFAAPAGTPLLEGTAGNDRLTGGDADEILHGGGGRDVLRGGGGADLFRFSELADSYRTASDGFADLIGDFDPARDRIDLSGLGFSGLGDGYHGTLAVQTNDAGTRTYLKSFETNAAGERFEVALEGDFSGLSAASLIFDARTPLDGGEGSDRLSGSSAAEELRGGAGRDTLEGAGGNDLLDGGAGRDTLSGGSGEDLFRFGSRLDSFRNYDSGLNGVDSIVDFNAGSDRIDVSALGYTGLGDGYHGTLAVVSNGDGTRTYLKDREADAEGNRFEIALEGNHAGQLGADDFVFAPLEVVGSPALAAA